MSAATLNAEWRAAVPYATGPGAWSRWVFQRPTRIEGFEFDAKPRGLLLSVKCGLEEQLIAGPVPLADVSMRFDAGAVVLSPTSGWKLTRLIFPTLKVGAVFEVMTEGFTGGFRPYGLEAF